MLRSRKQPNTSDLTNLDISFQSDITYRFANYVPTSVLVGLRVPHWRIPSVLLYRFSLPIAACCT